MTELKCVRCEYTWDSRNEEPKLCPRCKNRLDTLPKVRNIVGLQIGGTVGPNDQVGMYVAMPTRPGVGVKIDVNAIDPDQEVRQILNKTNDLKVHEYGKKILAEKDTTQKRALIPTLIAFAANVASCADNISKLLLWFKGGA